MQIRIPTRDCRVAVGGALTAARDALAKEKAEFSANAYQRLHDGAVHNGLEVNEARKQEMREMVARDVEHIAADHPLVERINMLEVQVKMLLYTKEYEILLHEHDFHVLYEHLPPNSHLEEQVDGV